MQKIESINLKKHCFQLIIFALAYYFLVLFSLHITHGGTSLTTGHLALNHLAAGLGIGCVLLFGNRFLPIIAVGVSGAYFSYFYALNSALNQSLIFAIGLIALGSAFQAFFGVWVLRKLCKEEAYFSRPSNVFKFLLAAILAALVGASFGKLSLILTNIQLSTLALANTGQYVWLNWWLADLVSILVLTPFVLTWLPVKTLSFNSLSLKAEPFKSVNVKALSTAVIVLVVSVLVFGDFFKAYHLDRLILFAAFAVLALVAFQYSLRGVTLMVLVFTAIALWFTTQTMGPFATNYLHSSIMLLMSFIVMFALIGLVLRSDVMHRAKLMHKALAKPQLTWFPFLFLIALTLLAWHIISLNMEEKAKIHFQDTTEDVQSRIIKRMQIYEEALKGGVGLFAASEYVTKKEWQAYYDQLNLQKSLPGILGFGYARFFQHQDKATFLDEARKQRGLAYDVKPAGERAFYAAIKYLEPEDERNIQAIGYDMYSESLRKAAMYSAMTSGETTISGKITLVQEIDEDVQPGILMYLPVYKNGDPIETAAQREQAILGFVYSPFRMYDLIWGILGKEIDTISVALFDGTSKNPDAEMYASLKDKSDQFKSAFSAENTLNIANHTWTLVFDSLPPFDQYIDRGKAQMVLILGLIVSMLLFMLIRSLSITKENAVALAKQMTAALRSSEDKYRSLAQSAKTAIIVTDEHRKIVSYNQAAAELFGYDESEIIGTDLINIVPTDILKLLAESIDETDTENNVRLIDKSFELEGLKKNGDEFHINISVSSWENEEGKFFSAIIRDISERNKLEQDLRQANASLEEFTSVASHDLKAPLRGISNLVDWITKDLGSDIPEEVEKNLDRVKQRTERMEALIKDLLAYSRASIASEETRLVDPIELVNEVIELQHIPKAFKVMVTSEVQPFETSETPLKTIIRNLVSNAVKHHDKTAGQIAIKVYSQQEYNVFEVTDDGPGIPEKGRDRIFKLFQSLSSSKDSTGVGLAVSKRMAEAHGGRIELVSSQEKRFTTFSVWWPKTSH